MYCTLMDPETFSQSLRLFVYKFRGFDVESLRQKVKEDGVVIDEKILKVDGFKSSNRCKIDA